MRHFPDMATLTQETGLRSWLLARLAANPDEVWVPGDFADLAYRPISCGDIRFQI